MVRWMIRRDMAYPVFNGKGDRLLPKLRQRDTIGLVHEDGANEDEIDGYMLYTLYKKYNLLFINKMVGNELAITNMIAKLKQKLEKEKRYKNIYIRVDGHKLVLQLLLKELGFVCTKYNPENEKMLFVFGVESW